MGWFQLRQDRNQLTISEGWVTRRILIAAAVLSFLSPLSVTDAQAQRALPHIGWLNIRTARGDRNDAIEQELRDLGWVEGRTVAIDRRSAQGESARLPRMAEELVGLKVVLILAADPPALAAARAATRTIPIVARVSNDPVQSGLVESLARPGGNVTGVYSEAEELTGKRLELLRDALPGLSKVAVLWDPDGERSRFWYRETETAARAMGLTILSIEIHGPKPDFDAAVRAAIKDKAGALITLRNPRIVAGGRTLATLTTRYKIPAMFDEQGFVQAGGLMSYGANLVELHRHLAAYVDKILRGARPGDLAIEQPTKFELVVNMKTAAALQIKIPPPFLLRADRVIE
jgi:putative ABC transport system substrate-binding protein